MVSIKRSETLKLNTEGCVGALGATGFGRTFPGLAQSCIVDFVSPVGLDWISL